MATAEQTGVSVARTSAPVVPGILMGLGLGGFVDGILLHQILQWHHMLTNTGDHPSDTVAGLETNMVADGLFHVGTWLLLLAGTLMMFRAWREGRLAPPWSAHVGLLLMGWGTFNLVEGIVNHHILGVHEVRDDVTDATWWNVGFLVVGALLFIVGAAMAGTERRPRARSPRMSGR